MVCHLSKFLSKTAAAQPERETEEPSHVHFIHNSSNYVYKQFHQHQEGDDVIIDWYNLASEQNKNKPRNLITDQSSYTLNIHYAQKQEAQISYLIQASCAIGDALEYLTWSPAAAPEERRCPAGPVSYLPALGGCLGHPQMSQMALEACI